VTIRSKVICGFLALAIFADVVGAHFTGGTAFAFGFVAALSSSVLLTLRAFGLRPSEGAFSFRAYALLWLTFAPILCASYALKLYGIIVMSSTVVGMLSLVAILGIVSAMFVSVIHLVRWLSQEQAGVVVTPPSLAPPAQQQVLAPEEPVTDEHKDRFDLIG
jgi:hypothetical protein